MKFSNTMASILFKKAWTKILVALLITSQGAQAYLSIAESAEVLPAHTHQLGGELQIITSKNSGGNINVFLDSSLNDSTSFRISIGGGSLDFNAFASAKWIPFPDFENQPAMGLRFGGGIARNGTQNFLEAQLSPIVSKKYETEFGLSIPYFALPFTFINTKTENFIASNLTVGSEFHYHEWKEAILGAELGLDLNKSWSYISFYATFPFESKKGFGK